MNWFFLTLISILFVSVANVLQRVLMKHEKSNPYSYAIIFHLLLALLNFICVVIFNSRIDLFSGNFFLLILASALWGATSVFLFKALKLIDVSEVTILSTTRVFVIIIASIVFLHESFSFQKALGTISIVIATFLVTNHKGKLKFNNGVVYTFLMVLFGGIALVIDSFNVKHYDPIFYNAIQNLLSGFCLLIVTPKALKDWRHFLMPHFLLRMLPLVFFSTVQGIAYLMALVTPGVTAQVGTIRQATVIVTVILAVMLLGERNNLLRKFLAAILVTIGVILLS